MTEKDEEVARLRAKRGGNRGVITKLSYEVEEILKIEPIDKQRLKVIAHSLNEKLKLVESLDEKIIDCCPVKEVADEIEESHDVNSRAMDILRMVMEATNPNPSDQGTSTVNATASHEIVPPDSASLTALSGSQAAKVSPNLDSGIFVPDQPGSSASPGIQSLGFPSVTHAGISQATGSSGMAFQPPINFNTIANSMPYQPKAKLPKLVLPKFRGEVTQWQNFWDSFNSAIHVNPQLSQIDKFNHLHSLLEGQASRAIQGLTRSEANYKVAIEMLHKRFGKPQNIISTHMDELLKIPGCTSDKASQLRFVYDKISINVRGLESLGVSSSQYGSLLIPVIMSKLPQEVRIQVARNTAQEVWQMSELLEVIRKEVEAREISEGVKTNVNTDKPKPNQTPRMPSAAALIANDGSRPFPNGSNGIQFKCVYCGGAHFSASCERVVDPQDRTEILKRDRRCFVCLKSGHRSSSCVKNCRRCHGSHHQSICRQAAPKRNDSSAPNENCPEPQQQQNSSLVSHATESPQLLHATTTASSGTRDNVLLQTATAIARNEDGSKSTQVKILFDSGSQRSYVTDDLKSKLGLKSAKTEMLHLNTFGEKKFRRQKCELLTLLLEDRNKEVVEISALSFPAICSPLPSRVDANSYPHLHGLDLADSSEFQDSIDVLIGSDFYWDLVTTEIVRGDFGPTAINSKFGWLLSGPTTLVTNSGTTVTNLIISGTSDGLFDRTQDSLADALKDFWETESIGIKGDLKLTNPHDEFNQNVQFNGERYEVELPWKADHPTISSDYELCVNRLKSLQRRMLNEPEVIQEYNQIIEDQVNKGIVEKIPAEEGDVKESETVHYLPHHAVIRSDRETTKLRIVYDGSAKPPERNHSLNDCLQTGPNHTPQLFDTLVKFRWHKIGLTADIEKAFLMVGINEADRDMLRFLWLKEPGELNSEIVHLRFTRLVFGLRPSPAILSSTIRHHLDSQVPEEFQTEFIEILKNSLYVDDLVTGEENETAALELYSKSREVMQRGGFNLRKWKTNSRAVQEAINRSSDSVVPQAVTKGRKSIAEEDESYAKTTTGPSFGANTDADWTMSLSRC